MKEESKARVVLILDAIILILGFITVSALLLSPSLISQLVRDYYQYNSIQVEKEDENEISEFSITFAETFFIYVYAAFLSLLGVLLVILYLGITKHSPGQLHCWVLTHCVLLAIMILSTVWTLASTPKLIVYHIPDLIYMCYRVVTIIIIREFRTLLRTARQLSHYNVQYSMSS